jgi:hypothetical protein
MRHPVDERLRDEIRRFRLAFTCQRCAVFDAEAQGCSHGYPSDEHRDTELDGRSELTFCKHFELW